jgi:hypothetical protein
LAASNAIRFADTDEIVRVRVGLRPHVDRDRRSDDLAQGDLVGGVALGREVDRGVEVRAAVLRAFEVVGGVVRAAFGLAVGDLGQLEALRSRPVDRLCVERLAEIDQPGVGEVDRIVALAPLRARLVQPTGRHSPQTAIEILAGRQDEMLRTGLAPDPVLARRLLWFMERDYDHSRRPSRELP